MDTTADFLAGLAVLVDADAEDRGWNSGHRLVKVEPGDGPNDIDLGLKDIEGHPLEELDGFTAPPEWLVIGICAEGWACKIDPEDPDRRPSQSKGRMRMRSVCLVARDGTIVSGLRLAGEGFEIKDDIPMGAIVDALREAMAL
jgi:hypothetical protein